MTARDLYKRARMAARDLEGIPGARVGLGSDLSTPVLHELAALLETKVDAFVSAGDRRPPLVIESVTARLRGVEITAQGARVATRADAGLRACIADVGQHLATAESIVGGVP